MLGKIKLRLFCSTSLPLTSTRWFNQHIQAFPHSKKCHWLLISATSRVIGKNSWECWESNPGLLGEKRKGYLCAMPSPFKLRVYASRQTSKVLSNYHALAWTTPFKPRQQPTGCWIFSQNVVLLSALDRLFLPLREKGHRDYCKTVQGCCFVHDTLHNWMSHWLITIVIYDVINDKVTFITRATWVRQGTQNNGFLSLFLCLFNRTNAAAGVSMELLNFFLLYFIFTTINISAALVQPRPTPSWSEIEWKEKRKILKFAFYCILAIGRLDTWPTGPQSFKWSTRA